MSALIDLFALSIAALPAVLFLALTQRDSELSDASLYRQFVVIFGLSALGLYGLSREPALQRQIDPAARLAHDFETHPVMAALVTYQVPMAETVRNAVRAELATGKRLDDAILSVHPGLFRAARERLAWADESSALAWARLHHDQLRWMQQHRLEACAALATLQAEGIRSLSGGLEPTLSRRYEAAVIAVFESSHRGLSAPHPGGIGLEAMQLAYRDISESLEGSYGAAVARQLSTPAAFQDPETAEVESGVLCAARIEQLNAVLALPPPVAARIVINLLR